MLPVEEFGLPAAKAKAFVAAQLLADAWNSNALINYLTALSNWKIRKPVSDVIGSPNPKPVPPSKWVVVDPDPTNQFLREAPGDKTMPKVVPGTELICAPEPDPPAPPVVTEVVSRVGRKIAGTSNMYYPSAGDNAPDGYEARPMGEGGPVWIKHLKATPMGFSAWYELEI